jgi:hypothetical protein
MGDYSGTSPYKDSHRAYDKGLSADRPNPLQSKVGISTHNQNNTPGRAGMSNSQPVNYGGHQTNSYNNPSPITANRNVSSGRGGSYVNSGSHGNYAGNRSNQTYGNTQHNGANTRMDYSGTGYNYKY